MNLRSVHAMLIMLSAVLAVLVGVWCVVQYSRDHAAMSLVWATISFAVSLGLIAYDSWFLRKTRSLR
jgi:MFS-type transporter involved in bile tolerance (Atg22 family)